MRSTRGKMSWPKQLVVIALSICMLFTMMPFMAEQVDGSGYVNAATNYSPDTFVEHALSHSGQRITQFKDSSGYSGDWCAWYVEHCSAYLGYGDIIPTSGCERVDNIAYSIVNNKGGKITVVNKAFYNSVKSRFNSSAINSGRVNYDASYKPKKGDLIFFNNSKGNWAHVGIVRENCSHSTKDVKTVEGNVGSENNRLSIVAKKTRTSTTDNSFYIVAYVTPKWSNTLDVKATNNASTGKPIVTWSKYPGATKYVVYSRTVSGEWEKKLTTTGTTFKNTSAKPTWGYYYKVKAYNGTKLLKTSKEVYRNCKIAKPEFYSISKDSKNRVVLKFRGSKSANCYKIYRSTSATGTYKLLYSLNVKTDTKDGVEHLFYTSSGTKGTKYYYKIQAVHTKWSGADSSLTGYRYIVR